jgi:F-type H+-transporting ATPase subunit b
VSYIAFNTALVLPSYSGKVFDFNATLPIMAAQFVLLVIFLDKTWFSPVGEVLDARDELVRNRLMAVKAGSDELEALISSADKLLKDARADAQAEMADTKRKAASKAETELANRKSELDSELAAAVKDLSNERASTQADIELQVAGLADYIVKAVLPAEFSL